MEIKRIHVFRKVVFRKRPYFKLNQYRCSSVNSRMRRSLFTRMPRIAVFLNSQRVLSLWNCRF